MCIQIWIYMKIYEWKSKGIFLTTKAPFFFYYFFKKFG